MMDAIGLTTQEWGDVRYAKLTEILTEKGIKLHFLENPSHQPHYYMSVNENGWRCTGCNLIFGRSKFLDRKYISNKVYGVLWEMTEAKLFYVSNGTEGEGITHAISQVCKRRRVYDQYSIVRFIITSPSAKSHAEYWKKH
jgi:hypothetical protein